MKINVSFCKGITFGSKYDFGSITNLTITDVNYRPMNNRKENLIILFGNNPIDCKEMLLPVCKTPQIDVCGYCGSNIYPGQFVPDISNLPIQIANNCFRC